MRGSVTGNIFWSGRKPLAQVQKFPSNADYAPRDADCAAGYFHSDREVAHWYFILGTGPGARPHARCLGSLELEKVFHREG